MKTAILTALLSLAVAGCCSTKKSSSGAPSAGYQTSSGMSYSSSTTSGYSATKSVSTNNAILVTPPGDQFHSWLFH